MLDRPKTNRYYNYRITHIALIIHRIISIMPNRRCYKTTVEVSTCDIVTWCIDRLISLINNRLYVVQRLYSCLLLYAYRNAMLSV